MRTYFHYFNVLFVLFCIIGSIIYGEKFLSFFLLLAVFQLSSGTIILLAKSYNLKSFKEILIYWTLVIIYFLVIINLIQNRAVKLIIIPILIASYHCYVTFKKIFPNRRMERLSFNKLRNQSKNFRKLCSKRNRTRLMEWQMLHQFNRFYV